MLCPFSALVIVKQADLPDCIVLWILKNLVIDRCHYNPISEKIYCGLNSEVIIKASQVALSQDCN